MKTMESEQFRKQFGKYNLEDCMDEYAGAYVSGEQLCDSLAMLLATFTNYRDYREDYRNNRSVLNHCSRELLLGAADRAEKAIFESGLGKWAFLCGNWPDESWVDDFRNRMDDQRSEICFGEVAQLLAAYKNGSGLQVCCCDIADDGTFSGDDEQRIDIYLQDRDYRYMITIEPDWGHSISACTEACTCNGTADIPCSNIPRITVACGLRAAFEQEEDW